MKFAFCFFRYFPYGGLQRDFIQIARRLKKFGYEIHVYTAAWEGEFEKDFHVHLLKTSGFQNHTRNHSFIKKLEVALKKAHYDLVIGFDPMPFLDVYYAAAICYQSWAKTNRSFFYKLLPRYHAKVKLEKNIFMRDQKTEILYISQTQKAKFIECYQTETERMHYLPPGIDKTRFTSMDSFSAREKIRDQFNIDSKDYILLMIASSFKTKGVDRSIKALGALPVSLRKHCHLFIIGKDNPSQYLKLASKQGVLSNVKFLGACMDVFNYLYAADIFLHPAYLENTGTVLLEALIAGLPVLTLDVCGYAHYITEAKAGIVLGSPFDQQEFNKTLEKMLYSEKRPQWKDNGITFGLTHDFYSLPEKAARIIESIAHKKVLV